MVLVLGAGSRSTRSTVVLVVDGAVLADTPPGSASISPSMLGRVPPEHATARNAMATTSVPSARVRVIL